MSTVIASHQPDSHTVLRCRAGDRLAFERRRTSYCGWIWCTNEHGLQAWVPEAYVALEGDWCVFKREYISCELEVEVGQQVEVLESESEWAWIRDDQGRLGWIPLECLKSEGTRM